MCGRYYIDENTAKGIEYILKKVERQIREERERNGVLLSNSRGIKEQTIKDYREAAEHPRDFAEVMDWEEKDIYPSQYAPVLTLTDESICCKKQRWGFPAMQSRKLIFNARSETAMDKKMFRSSVLQRRIVVPATSFYEWDKKKEKYQFYRKEKPVLYMAGFYNRYQEEDRFVILTTAANASMKPVHDRMPLILEEDEIIPWLFEKESAEFILHKAPPQLERKEENHQFTLFDT